MKISCLGNPPLQLSNTKQQIPFSQISKQKYSSHQFQKNLQFLVDVRKPSLLRLIRECPITKTFDKIFASTWLDDELVCFATKVRRKK
jgi:hypothetical protein